MAKRIHVGETHGRWNVVATAPVAPRGKARFFCRCACGTERAVLEYKLQSGVSRSCGCLCRERIAALRLTHGWSKTPTYRIWYSIRTRCLNPRSAIFCYYGGRGIRIEWPTFESFLRDMGERPSPKHSIDRIDTNGNYGPGNCRWATDAQQSRNMRSNHFIAHNGKFMVVTDWAKEIGMNRSTLSRRLCAGWPVEEALHRPIAHRG